MAGEGEQVQGQRGADLTTAERQVEALERIVETLEKIHGELCAIREAADRSGATYQRP